LAQEYTIFDRWFASVPGPTQPNRLYSHLATSFGLFRNDPWRLIGGIPGRSLENDIESAGLTWKTYFSE
jgi:phospholipase C